MSKSNSIASLIGQHKTLFIIVLVGLFVLELEIFAVAVMKSGRKSRMLIMDAHGNVIHETDGQQLSDFNKYYFQKTFGPLKNYQVRVVSRNVPFPFRAWFAAAVGLPVGLVLLFGFVIRAYSALFYEDSNQDPEAKSDKTVYGNRFEAVLARVSRLNIFIIGFLVFLAVFLYWVLPNLVAHIGHLGLETVIRFKWVFLGLGIAVFALLIWIVYLRYLLAKRSIECRVEVEKHRLQLELARDHQSPLQLAYEGNEMDSDARGWDEELAGKPKKTDSLPQPPS